MKKIVLILILFQINTVYSQFSEKISIDKSEIYSYDDNVNFIIKKMKEYKKGGFGYKPLRGYTSYSFMIKFTNHSSIKTEVDLDKIYLGDTESKIKSEIIYFDTLFTNGLGFKKAFNIAPQKSKTYFIFYIIQKKSNLCFVINNSINEIKIK